MKIKDMINHKHVENVRKHISNVNDTAKSTYEKTKKVIIDEFVDNVEAVKILRKKFYGHDVEVEEFRMALEQLFLDNAKLLTIGGISVLPGSALTLPITIKIAKKLGINLVPSKTFDSKD